MNAVLYVGHGSPRVGITCGAPTRDVSTTKQHQLKERKLVTSKKNIPNGDPEDAKQTLASNVRRLRKDRCWSQEMLAHFSGLHPTEVSRLERGLREPRLRTVIQLANALGVEVQDLIGTMNTYEFRVTPEGMYKCQNEHVTPGTEANGKNEIKCAVYGCYEVVSTVAMEEKLAKEVRERV